MLTIGHTSGVQNPLGLGQCPLIAQFSMVLAHEVECVVILISLQVSFYEVTFVMKR